MDRCEVLCNSVIKNDTLFLTKVSSAECIKRRLFQPDTCYEVSVEDVEIQLEKGHVTDGIKFTFCLCEETDEEGVFNHCYVDCIMSDMIGTFVSDRY